MDNEKYGIELELITNKFNQKIQQVKNSFKGIGDKKINLNANTAQIEYLKQKIKELSALLDYNQRKPFMNYTEMLKTRAELEKLNNQYKNLTFAQDTLSRESVKGNLNMQKAMEKLTSKLKRFGLALLSIRSIYSLISRASSAYLSQDTELANKLQAVWAGLGAILAPIIERVVDILAKGVRYINIFIKALTGVDLLARATSKSMKTTAGSAKALNKALAGFDELTNLDTDAGGGTGASLGGLDALKDVEIDTTWAERIRTFGEWIKRNWQGVLASFLGFVTILKGLNPLVEAFGLKLGIIKALGIGLVITGIVYAITSLIKYLKDPSFENFGKIIQGIGIAVIGLGAAFFGLPVAVAGAIVLVIGTIIRFWDDIKAFFQSGIDWLSGKSDWIHEKFGDTIGWIYDTFVENLQRILNWFDLFFTSIKGIFDGIIKVVKGVFTGNWQLAWEGIKEIFANVWNYVKNTFLMFVDWVWKNTIQPVINLFGKLKDSVVDLFKNIGTKVGEVISRAFNSVINSVLREIENILNSPIRAINQLIDVINAVPGINLGRLSTFKLPRLATGTNYVPEDQLAMIHKGEAVVPKKFNSREYFGGTNDETNAKLDRLIEIVDNIEINPYTTIRDVGKASLSYINSKSRQLGESVVV